MITKKAITAKDAKENKAGSIGRWMTRSVFAFGSTLPLISFASLASLAVQVLDLG
jgi:hypothetical protein